MQSAKSVAVITSTIGRPELEIAIQSVQAQTYPCTHYVFVDGEQYFAAAQTILEKYPNVTAIYLPMNTGANGWTNSAINAIAPFLVKEDVLCYLDDDNWYQPNHVATCVARLDETGADYVYALRNLYSPSKEFICEDCFESIGYYQNRVEYPLEFRVTVDGVAIDLCHRLFKARHIDTNCYAMRKQTAIAVSSYWYSGLHNDTNVFEQLIEAGIHGKCTKHFTVNYILDSEKFDDSLTNFFLTNYGKGKDESQYVLWGILQHTTKLNIELHGNQYPWANE